MALGSAKQTCLDSLEQCIIESFEGNHQSDIDLALSVIDALLTFIDDEDISMTVEEIGLEEYL